MSRVETAVRSVRKLWIELGEGLNDDEKMELLKGIQREVNTSIGCWEGWLGLKKYHKEFRHDRQGVGVPTDAGGTG